MPFLAGKSGNPQGGRKAKIWRDALNKMINYPFDETIPKGITVLDQLVATQIGVALNGDTSALRDIADRLDGKVPQGIIGGDEGDNPISFSSVDPSKLSSQTMAEVLAAVTKTHD